jgi:hypothetical protein
MPVPPPPASIHPEAPAVPNDHSRGAGSFDPVDVTGAFAPLRVEPPPHIFATWWLRYVLFLAQIVGIAVVLMTEYAEGGRLAEPRVVLPYVLAVVVLVSWSALAMVDAARLVPATLYRRGSSAVLAVALWLGALAAPVGAFGVVEWAQERFADDPDDLATLVVTAGSLLVCFLFVWLPFRYHIQQARRIGAPARIVAAWFWLPLVATVGVLAINALGLSDLLAEDGVTDVERTVQLAVVFGAPALVFALATWRATTVFDEVIDLRWRRWRTEWEQTLASMAAQPAPGPEASPTVRRR